MSRTTENWNTRRRFLRFLAASPLLAGGGLIAAPLAKLFAAEQNGGKEAHAALAQIAQGSDLITSPDQALDIMDFEPVARKVLPPAHFGYLATGVDDDATVRANREGFSHLEIRARRMVDVSKIDTSVRLFGNTWSSPIVLAPVSAQRAFHHDGEIATAKAARAKEHLMILSTAATTSVEDVIAARGAPVWQQLYTTDVWDVTRAIVKRAEAAGCPVLAVPSICSQEAIAKRWSGPRESTSGNARCVTNRDSPDTCINSPCLTAWMFLKSTICIKTT